MWWWSGLWARTICAYYGLALAFTTFALIFSCYYSSYARRQISQRTKDEQPEIKSETCERIAPTQIDEDQESESDVDALQSRMKMAKHQAIIDHLSANMTEEQLIEEKEVEKAQLAAILNLLKEQKDKFQVTDMKELEEQLSLYR